MTNHPNRSRIRQRPHLIVRNGTDVVALFPTALLAEEAMYDLGCYVDRMPTPEDTFEVVPAARWMPRSGEAT